MLAERAGVTLTVVRAAPGEDLVHEGLGVEAFGRQGQAQAARLLGLPPLLDAVVYEGHETGGHDDTVTVRLLYCPGKGGSVVR